MDHPDAPSMSMDQDKNMTAASGMMTYLHVQSDVTILFYGWHTTTWPQLLGSCVAIGLLALLTESMTSLRLWVHHKLHPHKPLLDETSAINDNASLTLDDAGGRPKGWSCLRGSSVIQTLLFMLQTLLRFMLMLVVMTFNFWLLLSVVVGSGLGYWFFTKPGHAHFVH